MRNIYIQIAKNKLIIIILCLALFLRIYNLPTLTTFSGEEGKDFLIVRKIITDKNLTLLGPMIGPYNNISQVFLGPAYYYLILLPLLIFNYHPTGPAYFISILSTLSIFLVFLTAKKIFDIRFAYFASAFYAFSPVLVEQGKSSNPAYYIPIFSAVFFYSLIKVLYDKKNLFLVPVGLSLGLLIQFHLTAIVASLGTILAFLIFKPRIKIKELFLLPISFLLAISPVILFEARNKFFITNSILAQIAYAKNFRSSTLDLVISVFSNIQNFIISLLSVGYFAFFTIVICLILAVPILLSATKTREHRKILILIYLWILLNSILVAAYNGPFVSHYFATSFIPLTLLVVYSLNLIKFKNLGFGVLIALIILNLFSNNLFRKNGYTMPDGWNLRGVETASQVIINDLKNHQSGSFNVASTLDGDTRARPFRYFLDLENYEPLGVEEYPQTDRLYLVSKDSADTVKNYQVWEVSSVSPFMLEKLAHVQNGINVYKLTKEKEK